MVSHGFLLLIMIWMVSVGAPPEIAGANLTPRLSPALHAQVLAARPGEQITAIVHLKGQADLDQFRSLIEGTEMAGCKLNFLLQEMNREANTIGSKSNDVEMTRAMIVIKEEIERLREQVQNVE